MHLVVIDRNEEHAVIRKHLPQQFEPRHHHAQPFVMPREVLAVHHLAQPFLHHGRVHVVVVNPILVASVVGWVSVDAIHLTVVIRQQRLQRLEAVAMHHQVVVQARLRRQALGLHRLQFMERHQQMEILHQRLPFEIQ